jgi:hypothetical protein
MFAELGVRDTVNVAWLVGASSQPPQMDAQPPPMRPRDSILASSHPYVRQYIDIFENSQPPSHLAVKEAGDETVESFAASGGLDVDDSFGQSRRAYTLARSKSACDLAYANLVAASSSPPADETQSEAVPQVAMQDKATLTRLSSSSKRNRTILGSFPLFYKLSQHQQDGEGAGEDAGEGEGASAAAGRSSAAAPPANSHHQRPKEEPGEAAQQSR